MGTTTSAQSRVGADTPIWDEEFAARWEALMADQAPAEPAKGKGKARPPRKLRDTPMA